MSSEILLVQEIPFVPSETEGPVRARLKARGVAGRGIALPASLRLPGAIV
ncbi:hypothetical protein SAMN05518801_1117 [Novosphingobium sp. CF614]|nr:hypothetical protein SAMN05518801_1117 [Novosphingobium sp. CF614]